MADGYSALPARAVANIVIYTATDDVTKAIKDPRNCVGNQQIEAAKVLVELSRRLPEFRDAAAWDKLGIDRLKNGALSRFILPDGGDLEQSFNYNSGLFNHTTNIAEIFEGEATPDWVDKLKSLTVNRNRLFSAIRHSSGTAPSVGNNCYGRDLPTGKETFLKFSDKYNDALVENIQDQLIYKAKNGLPTPSFTSIAFPYSGYYLMRNGWTNQSSSLFFKSSRPGAGHNHPDNNSIELCAYGRHLLVDREAPPYWVEHLPVDERKDFPWVLEYKGEEARWTANNLLIDGCGQLPGVNNKGYNSTIPDQTWYTSEAFDFVQGSWSRTFKSGEPMDLNQVRSYTTNYGATATETAAQLAAATQLNAVPHQSFEATHTRQVIFLRQANAWIVTDWANRNDGQKAKELTQLWHLPSPNLNLQSNKSEKNRTISNPLCPGFEKEQVVCDQEAQRILTTNPENVNLAILSAVPGKLRYISSYGEKYPHRGWANLAPSMVSGYVPAVDLQVICAPDQPIVTVLVPIPQGEKYEQRVKSFSKEFTNGQTRIKLTFSDDTAVEYVVSNSVSELTAGQAKAKAEGLLLMTRQGNTQGLSITRSDKKSVFQMKNNKMSITHEMTVPVGFSWEETAKGLVPTYGLTKLK